MDYKGDIFYIGLILEGNSTAFSYIVERHRNKAYNLAFRMCGSHEEAEELAQDSFLKAYRSLKSFEMKSSFSTWLYRIVYNTTISQLRTKKKGILSLEDFPADATDFIGINTSEEEAERPVLRPKLFPLKFQADRRKETWFRLSMQLLHFFYWLRPV